MNTGKAAVAEFFGTFWLVFGGTGAAVLAASVGDNGIGWLGVSLAFGLTVVTMAYAVGPHLGRALQPRRHPRPVGRRPLPRRQGRRLHRRPGRRAPSPRRAVLYVIASGRAGFTLADGFAANGYGDHSPAGYSLAAAIVIELLLTFVFLLVIHGVTDRRAPAGLAPLAIGLTLTLIHLISIPVTNTSREPRAQLAPALFVGDWALAQLWVFIIFPTIGGIIGGLAYRYLLEVPAARARQGRRAGRGDGVALASPTLRRPGRRRGRLAGGTPAPRPLLCSSQSRDSAVVAQGGAMSVLLVVNSAPYGSEGPYHAFRLAEALALRDERVEVFLMGDAVAAARAGQDPRGAHASLEQMLEGLLEQGVDVSCCGTCCATRGLTEDDLVARARVATIHDLAEATVRSDRVVSF